MEVTALEGLVAAVSGDPAAEDMEDLEVVALEDQALEVSEEQEGTK